MKKNHLSKNRLDGDNDVMLLLFYRRDGGRCVTGYVYCYCDDDVTMAQSQGLFTSGSVHARIFVPHCTRRDS